MSLSANALTTVAELEGELGVYPGSATALLERLIGAASDAIDAWCGHSLARAGVTETFVGNGRARLLLPRTPLSSVSTVTVDGVTLAAADYSIQNAASGYLVRALGEWPLGAQIAVTYTGGYATPAQVPGTYPTRSLPFQVEQACLMTCVSLYRARGRDPQLSSEALGDYTAAYRGANAAIGTGAGGIIPDAALPLLAPFRRVQ
jgi:hypothetical protein